MERNRLKSLAGNFVAMVAMLTIGYLLVYFVTASFTATGNGPVRWDLGWQSTKELIWNR